MMSTKSNAEKVVEVRLPKVAPPIDTCVHEGSLGEMWESANGIQKPRSSCLVRSTAQSFQTTPTFFSYSFIFWSSAVIEAIEAATPTPRPQWEALSILGNEHFLNAANRCR